MLIVKDFSVSPKTNHNFDLGAAVYSLNSGKSGIVVGYAGLPASPSYCVQWTGDDGYSESMPFRYANEKELQGSPVDTEMDADRIVAKMQTGARLLNREMAYLVEQGVAEYIYNDPESNAPTGIALVQRGDIYADQIGLEESANLLRL